MDYQLASTLTKEDLFSQLKTSDSGLTQQEASKRKLEQGSNILSAHQVSAWNIFLEQLKSAFVYLLIFAALISYALGEAVDGTLILLFVAINTVLGFWQEYRAAVSLAKLRGMISRTSIVIRDGKPQNINDSELVVGDIIELRAGDLIPAEVRFFAGTELSADESILTGESITAHKSITGQTAKPESLRDAENIGFSGTLVATGEGRGVVVGIGNDTQVGEIAKLTVETETQSGFSLEIEQISKAVIGIMFATIIFIILLNFFVKGPAANIAELALFSIALAVGVVPEALPLVITISLSMGAIALARKKVIPKRLSAIEDLGSIDILCTDKTGTITENMLTVTDVLANNENLLLKHALMAISIPETSKTPTDPFDKAIYAKASDSERSEFEQTTILGEIPFDPVRRRNCVLAKNAADKELIVRGAYEEVSQLCTNMPAFNLEELENFLTEKGQAGKRVLAVASRAVQTENITSLELEEHDLTFEGLIAFEDPLKPTAAKTVEQAKELGLKIKILTGDSPNVAFGVGKAIGLVQSEDQIMTGKEYELLSEVEREEAVERILIFARVSPKEKFDILKHLQKKHLVGFLGEGFNDAPGLKVAHVGLVVDNAADIAKDSADIILLSKDLKTIVDGIMEGRKTFTNTVRYIRTTLASNFGNFFAVAFSSLFVPFLPMLPIQILLLNLMTDFPMVSIATDNVSKNTISKPTRYKLGQILGLCIVLGIVSTAFDFATFFYFVRFGERTLQTLWFMESALTELVVLFSIRATRSFVQTARPGKWIIALTGLTVFLVFAIPFSSIGRDLFSFTTPQPQHIATLLVLVTAYFITTEIVKLSYYKVVGLFGKGTA